MFGIRARYVDYQRGEVITSNKETVRVGADGTFTCRDPHLALWAQRDGFEVVVDLSGKVTRDPAGYSKKDAAAALGVLVPTLNKWVASGKLHGYFLNGELIGFASDDVDRLAASRANS